MALARNYGVYFRSKTAAVDVADKGLRDTVIARETVAVFFRFLIARVISGHENCFLFLIFAAQNKSFINSTGIASPSFGRRSIEYHFCPSRMVKIAIAGGSGRAPLHIQNKYNRY